MMKWIKENDVILRVTSLLIAVLLWAYAMSNDQSDVKQSFRDLPIQLEGVNILKDQDLVFPYSRCGNTCRRGFRHDIRGIRVIRKLHA